MGIFLFFPTEGLRKQTVLCILIEMHSRNFPVSDICKFVIYVTVSNQVIFTYSILFILFCLHNNHPVNFFHVINATAPVVKTIHILSSKTKVLMMAALFYFRFLLMHLLLYFLVFIECNCGNKMELLLDKCGSFFFLPFPYVKHVMSFKSLLRKSI